MLEDPDMRAAIIACEANFNCDEKASRGDSLPLQPAFRVKSLFDY